MKANGTYKYRHSAISLTIPLYCACHSQRIHCLMAEFLFDMYSMTICNHIIQSCRRRIPLLQIAFRLCNLQHCMTRIERFRYATLILFFPLTKIKLSKFSFQRYATRLPNVVENCAQHSGIPVCASTLSIMQLNVKVGVFYLK